MEMSFKPQNSWYADNFQTETRKAEGENSLVPQL